MLNIPFFEYAGYFIGYGILLAQLFELKHLLIIRANGYLVLAQMPMSVPIDIPMLKDMFRFAFLKEEWFRVVPVSK